MSVDTTAVEFYREISLADLGETMLTIFECVGVERGSATYVSTPITTGELLLRWHEANDSPLPHNELRSEVVQKNLASVRPLIKRVRQAVGSTPVVEPVSMNDVPGWQQSDYHAFWCAFIERYASRVVFNEGWHLSNGCLAEYVTAALSGVETLDHEMEPLPVEKAIALIDRDQARLEAAGLDTTLIRRAAAALHHIEDHGRA